MRQGFWWPKFWLAAGPGETAGGSEGCQPGIWRKGNTYLGGRSSESDNPRKLPDPITVKGYRTIPV
jgi:hypothetical protein